MADGEGTVSKDSARVAAEWRYFEDKTTGRETTRISTE